MTDYARLASRLFNNPLMIRPEKAEMLVAVLAERLGVARMDRLDGTTLDARQMNRLALDGRAEAAESEDRYYEVAAGVALLPIDGTLVHKSGYVRPTSGMTGYDGLMAMHRQAMNDDAVKAIWLDIDSPGGEVSGCFDAADEIFASNKKNGGKPTIAMVNEQACSAAYAIASAADRIYMPRTGTAGSIGVYILYVDQQKMLAKEGLEPRFIRSGEQKARGSGLEDIDDRTLAKFQASVDKDRELFAATVARNRGIAKRAVMATEGDWFGADEALQLGLIDGIFSEIEAFAKLQRSVARSR